MELIKQRLVDLESNLNTVNKGNSNANLYSNSKESKGQFNKVTSEIGDLRKGLDKISNSLKSLQNSNESALAKIKGNSYINQNQNNFQNQNYNHNQKIIITEEQNTMIKKRKFSK